MENLSREQTIAALELCFREEPGEDDCDKCPYMETEYKEYNDPLLPCQHRMIKDAIEYLKEK